MGAEAGGWRVGAGGWRVGVEAGDLLAHAYHDKALLAHNAFNIALDVACKRGRRARPQGDDPIVFGGLCDANHIMRLGEARRGWQRLGKAGRG